MAHPLGVAAAKAGAKRKLDDADSDYDSDILRPPPKRISPFHNTPQQKKETKRKILKLSLKKMHSIDCPETFLRRSVLINNLARSLQDDLKNDDKLWDRLGWGGNYDLDTISCRQPYHPTPHRLPAALPPTGHDVKPASHTGSTLLTNASPGCGVWTLSSMDDDTHLLPSENDRVTRDLAQSHERLARTVDRFTSSFGNTDPEDCFSSKSLCCSDSDAGHHQQQQGTGGFPQVPDQLRTPASTCQVASSSTHLSAPASSQLSHTSSTTNVPSDINRNTIPTSCKYTSSSSSCSRMSSSSDMPLGTPSGLPAKALASNVIKPCSSNVGGKSEPMEPPWCSDLDLPDELVSPYSTCGGSLRQDTLLLDHLDSIPPIISPPSESPPDCSHQVAAHAPDEFCVPSLLPPSGGSSRCNSLTSLLDSDVLSWNMGGGNGGSTICEPCTITTASGSASPCTPPPPPVSPSGSCSSEAERMDTGLIPGPLAEPDKYTSQGLREFDVIYNNLISVLIGGN